MVLAVLLCTLFIRFEVVTQGVIPARGDTLTGFLPHKSFVARTVQSGEMPLWDPHIFCGQPFLADPQTAVFSPFSIPFYVLPIVPAFIVYMLLKHVLAGIFTYGFVRTLGVGRAGALFAGIAFSFSSTMFRQIPWQEVASTTVWAPLLFWLCEIIIRRPDRLVVACVLPLFFAFENLAGHPQLAYYVYLALGLYCGARLLGRTMAGSSTLRRSAASAAILLVTVLLGLGLSMVQVLPLQEFQSATRYGEAFPIEEAANPSSSLEALPSVFIGGVYPDYEDHINTSYIGILALALVPIGLLASGWIGALFGLIALIAVLIAVGLDTPVFPFLFDTLPGFSHLHGPVRFLPIATLAVAVLAGLGFHRLVERFAQAPRRGGNLVGVVMALLGLASGAALANRIAGPFIDGLPFAITNAACFGFPAALLLVAFISGHIGRAAFVGLGLVLAFIDLSHFDRVRYPNVYGQPDKFLEEPETVHYLNDDPEIFRAGLFTNGFAVQKRVKHDEKVIKSVVASIYPNLSLHHGTHDPQGVYSLKIERYTDFVRRLNGDVKGGRWILDRLTMLGNPFSPLFDLLNMKYVLTPETNPIPVRAPLRETDGRFALPGADESTHVMLDLRYPAGDEPLPPLTVTVDRAGASAVSSTVEPAWFDAPIFCAVRAYEAAPPAVDTEAVFRLDGTGGIDGSGWELVSGSAEQVGGRLRLAGTEPRQLLSPAIDFEHRLAVRYTATPTQDNAGITVSILDAASDETLYTCIYGDEGFTGFLVRQRGVKSTRAVRTRAGREDSCEFFLEQDRLGFSLGERSLLRFRDFAAPMPERVRIEIGVRGGAVDFDSIEVHATRADQRFRSVRALIELPAGSLPTDVRIGDGPELQRVTLLDQDKFTEVLESDGVRVFRNERVLPRVFLVGGYRVFEDGEQLLDRLGSDDFDPRAEVLLSRRPGLERGPGPLRLEGTGVSAEITRYTANSVECRTECDVESILYLGDASFAGWTVTVDGEPATLLEANHCFRAVALTPGEHEVRFRYRPTSFRLGMAISLGTVFVWIAFGILAARIRRREVAAS